MSTKRKIVIFSILLLISVLMLVSSVVFDVKKIDVVFSLETNIFSANEIVEASKIKKNSSIFFVNKKKARFEIEKNIPYAQVEKIASKFPSTVEIRILERKKLFVFKKETETSLTYFALDKNFKVLESNNTNLFGELCVVKNLLGTLSVGEFADAEIIFNFAHVLTQNFDYSDVEFIDMFKSIEKNGGDLILETGKGCTVKIVDCANRFVEKIAVLGFLETETNLTGKTFEIKEIVGEIGIR